jgi:hypothetical protein
VTVPVGTAPRRTFESIATDMDVWVPKTAIEGTNGMVEVVGAGVTVSV